MPDYREQLLKFSLLIPVPDDEPDDAASLALKTLIHHWIDLTLQPATISSNYTSRNLKNEFERCTGIFITNDQFNAVMLNLSYLPVDPTEADCHFKIQPRYPHKGSSYEIHIHCIYNAPQNLTNLFRGYLTRFKAIYPYPKGGSAH